MCGSEWAVSTFCRSRIVMCIPRVFRVRALRLWFVYFEMVRGIIGGGWLLRLFVVGFLVVCEGRRFGVFLGVGSGGCCLVLVAWGMGVVLEFVLLRVWADGEGFHALHWNMLSWFGFCTRVLQGFLFG